MQQLPQKTFHLPRNWLTSNHAEALDWVRKQVARKPLYDAAMVERIERIREWQEKRLTLD